MNSISKIYFLLVPVFVVVLSCKPTEPDAQVLEPGKVPVEMTTFVESKNTGYGRPNSFAFDKAGDMYFSDGFAAIYKVSIDGKVSLYAGSSFGYQDGPRAQAKFSRPDGLTFDSNGNLYFTEMLNRCIRKISPDGQVSTFAGQPNDKTNEGGKDGVGNEARFIRPRGLVIDKAGTLYVTEGGYSNDGIYNSSVRKITPDAKVTTIAGFSGKISESIYESEQSFGEPNCITIDKIGNLYLGALGVIYKVNPSGTFEIFSGKRYNTGTKNGTLQSAQYGLIQSLSFDYYGNLYVGESGAGMIRKITPAGEVSNLAGNRYMGYRDGPLDTAEFISAESLAFDQSGNMYIADAGNSAIRKIVFK